LCQIILKGILSCLFNRFVYIFGYMRANFKIYHWVMLGPAAGVTDSLTRQLARKWGADAVVSELISSDGLTRNCQKTAALLAFEEVERPMGIQLFGADPERMARAAAIAASYNPDFIDLNFGCPARKIVGNKGGASLLLDLPRLQNIIESVVKKVALPVTVKYRSGWDEKNNVAVDVARIAQDAGAAAICLHPRTKMQGFAGNADWSQIAEVKQAVQIPVIGSGDIDCPRKAAEMFRITGCDAIMICRASFGNPWIFNRVKKYLITGILDPEPDPAVKIETAIDHLGLSVGKFGPWPGLIRMRATLCWYISGLPRAGEIRSRLVLLPTEAEVVSLLREYKNELIERGYGDTEIKALDSRYTV